MVRLLGSAVYRAEIAWNGVTYINEVARLKSFTVTRGMSEDQRSVEAGTCSLIFADKTGYYNPANAASPLAPDIAKPLRPVRVGVTYNAIFYSLFTGYTRRHEADPGRDAREARIDCVDGFILLDRARPVIASTGTTTTGAAIGLILDSVTFPAGAARLLDAGDTIPDFSADGSQTALALIAGLLETERGMFYFTAAGQARYQSRGFTNTSPYTTSQGTIASTMRAIAPGVDLDTIVNRATVTRPGGAAQTVEDAASVAAYNYGVASPITSAYLNTDAQAYYLALHQVTVGKDPVRPVRALGLDNGNATAWVQLLTREINDRVTVTEALGGTSGDYHIKRIVHEANWSAGIHRGSWSLRERAATQPFVVGVSSVGGSDIISY